MDGFKYERIRNVVLLGHGGCGKTTIAEAMAYLTGVTKRPGKVEDGSTISDYDKEEAKRGFSISTSLVPVIWEGTIIQSLKITAHSPTPTNSVTEEGHNYFLVCRVL